MEDTPWTRKKLIESTSLAELQRLASSRKRSFWKDKIYVKNILSSSAQVCVEKSQKEINKMAKLCSVCQYPLEKDDAPVIAMGAFGTPKCVCEKCENLIETATTSRDPNEITEACKALGESLTRGNTGDEQIIASVNEIIYSANERCNAIKDGTYDFSLDEKEPEEEFEITEDLMETEEDRAKDEHDAKIAKIVDTVGAWIGGVALTLAVVFLIIKFVL